MSEARNTSAAEPAAADTNASCCSGAPRLRSIDMFRNDRRLIIEHRGEEYCLRLTRNERLILTKL